MNRPDRFPPVAGGPITIVTPPIDGGVRDYATLLADAAGAQLLAFEGAARTRAAHPGETLFVQVSHYGYQKRGVPLHLLSWIRARKRGGARVGFCFHELFAFGPPWRSSFWLSPLQRYITGEMARLADFWITNQHSSAQWLLRAGGAKPHQVLPVFSNLGEAPHYVASRANEVAVCGSASLRAHTYRSAGPGFFDWAAGRGLQVHDIGPTLADPELRGELARRGVREHGRLPSDGVSRILARAMYGLAAYPAAHVAKSSIFAAYCAHGLCPLLISEAYPQADGLVKGTHYRGWPAADGQWQDEGSSVGQRAFDWYAAHSVSVHAETMLRLSRQARVLQQVPL